MTSIYSNYLDRITDILDKKPNLETFSIREGLEKADDIVVLRDSNDTTLVPTGQNLLPVLFGTPVGYKSAPTIGTHPNLTDMKFGDKRYQYCTSMFIDIKGSTNLSVNYNLEQVRMMKDAILSVCIQTVTIFGGHVQRLQGDGLYVQFTDVNIHQNDMIINALNAATVLCQFISTTLADLFVKRNLKPLRIKVGIDFAEEEKCLWSHYGLPGCNELTATSLHVDLAAKLQSRCGSNEIRIGEHVKQFLDLPSDYLSIPSTIDGKEEPFIKSSIGYRQYIFDWRAYLYIFDFVYKENNQLAIDKPVYSLSCYVVDNTGKEFQYFQKNGSLPKHLKLKFVLMKYGKIYKKMQNDTITWRIVNRGDEAAKDNSLVEQLDCYKNNTNVTVDTVYLGHHYMECILKHSFENSNHRIKFGVYVR